MADFRPGEKEKVQGELIEKTIKCPKTNGFMSKEQQIIFLTKFIGIRADKSINIAIDYSKLNLKITYESIMTLESIEMQQKLF